MNKGEFISPYFFILEGEVIMINFINQIINGLSTGSMYALVAIGYTMVYGIAKMINFAHGDIIMAGLISH